VSAPEHDGLTDDVVLAAKASIPDYVVSRGFAQETVVLNLRTGIYHGLDTVGGRLLELLPRAATVRAAALQIADEYARPADEVEADIAEFLRALQTRGLVDLNTNGHR